MEKPEATRGRQAGDDTAASAGRFIVIVGKPAGEGSADRIEEPDRLLRMWSLLEATYEQMDWAALPPEDVPGLQRQFQALHRELERAVSPSLVAELRRILPSGSVPGLQRQVQAIHRELDRAVSPSLAAELRRILPSGNAAPSAAALRIEYAVLLSWSGSLMVEMLRALAAAHERLQQPSAAA